MKIRKQVYDLTLADLESTPVWEFALDEEGEKGQDEATIRPVQGSFPVDPGDGMFIVRARFRLADGTPLSGYLSPPVQGDSSLSNRHPVIVTSRGQVMFWYGAFPPKAETLTSCYAKLGKTAAQVFPVYYEAEVPVLGGPIRGSLNGFAHFRSLKDRTVVEVR